MVKKFENIEKIDSIIILKYGCFQSVCHLLGSVRIRKKSGNERCYRFDGGISIYFTVNLTGAFSRKTTRGFLVQNYKHFKYINITITSRYSIPTYFRFKLKQNFREKS